mmetsp:Transcript_45947/g.139287  ORF Transcript_45947/g.139287 Transcript_45947/m.139287 type:complete len:409 (-) Transcript_45947:128-1354(-)
MLFEERSLRPLPVLMHCPPLRSGRIRLQPTRALRIWEQRRTPRLGLLLLASSFHSGFTQATYQLGSDAVPDALRGCWKQPEGTGATLPTRLALAGPAGLDAAGAPDKARGEAGLQFVEAHGEAGLRMSSRGVGEPRHHAVLKTRCYCPDGAPACARQQMRQCSVGDMMLKSSKGHECAHFVVSGNTMTWTQYPLPGPVHPAQVQELWDWCDCGKGIHSLRVWPVGAEAEAVTVAQGKARLLKWKTPVSEIHWTCDGMSDTQTTMFSSPLHMLSVHLSVNVKTPFCLYDSGRLLWHGWRMELGVPDSGCPRWSKEKHRPSTSTLNLTLAHEVCGGQVGSSWAHLAIAGFAILLLIALVLCECLQRWGWGGSAGLDGEPCGERLSKLEVSPDDVRELQHFGEPVLDDGQE